MVFHRVCNGGVKFEGDLAELHLACGDAGGVKEIIDEMRKLVQLPLHHLYSLSSCLRW